MSLRMKNILKKQVCEEEELLPYKSGEKRILIGKSIGIVLILNYFFYQSLWALFPLSCIGMMYYKMEKRYLYQKKKEQMKHTATVMRFYDFHHLAVRG